ncbi:hypothetical protein [Micavibrio aeruginosavorus]|uniref:hypothetical protein n=1 Tax=Micavibrio aeruginosavorus TaxID=349221 RepID=UPI003F4ACC70
MKHLLLTLFLALSLSAPAMAQDTLSAPAPGTDRLGIPSAPQHMTEGQIAADDAAGKQPATAPAATPDAAQPAPGAGLTILAPKTPGPRSVADIPPEDLPKELLDEMVSVEKECSDNTFFSAFQDCRCIAVKYLDERIKRGPYAVRNIIMNDVNTMCPNTPGVAGYVYKSCSEYMSWTRPDFEAFCRCTANLVADRYTRLPKMNNEYISGLRKRAMLECGMPAYGATNDPDVQY